MRVTLTILTFLSTLFFPWPLSAFLAITTSTMVPLLPLAAGIFADTLYYAPGAAHVPYFSFFGAVATAVAYFVRSRLSASIID